jgi:hypothetical protein
MNLRGYSMPDRNQIAATDAPMLKVDQETGVALNRRASASMQTPF